MQNNILIRAVTEDLNGTLKPVVEVAYSLESVAPYDLVGIAVETNQKLGYNLFEDLHYPRLVKDFAIVARAVQQNAIKGDLHEFKE